MFRWRALRCGSSRRSMSSWVSGRMSTRRMSPRSRIMGGWPTFRCRSDASCFITMRNSLLTSGSLAAMAGDCASVSRWGASALIGRSAPEERPGGIAVARKGATGDATLGEIGLGGRDVVLVVVEDAGRQGGVRLALGEHAEQVLGVPRPAAGHHGDAHGQGHGARHLDVV